MPNDPFYYISVTRLMERRRTAVDSLRTNDSNYHPFRLHRRVRWPYTYESLPPQLLVWVFLPGGRDSRWGSYLQSRRGPGCCPAPSRGVPLPRNDYSVLPGEEKTQEPDALVSEVFSNFRESLMPGTGFRE